MNSDIVSLREYTLHAKKFAHKAAKNYRLFGYVLNSNYDEVITDLISAMVKSDMRWNPDLSINGTIYGFRARACKWIVGQHVKKFRKRGGKIKSSLKDTKAKTPDLIAISNEEKSILSDLISSGILTDKQRQGLEMYYYDELTLEKVGNKFGTTKEGARQLIQRALANLRSLASEQYPE